MQSSAHVLIPRGGDELDVHVFTYPVEQCVRHRILDLLHTEWDTGDYDWRAAMGGAYADSLMIRTALATAEGQDAATATVVHAVTQPEVAVLTCVLTRPEFRGRGIAANLTDLVTKLGLQSGCKAAYLGATPSPNCVYLRVGYRFYNGGVMRRLGEGHENFDADYFRSGQDVHIRPAVWGDLAGVSCLLTRPYDWFAADYQRALLSGRYIQQRRCASIFAYIYDDVNRKRGICCVLVGQTPHRILGIASISPGATEIQRHAAMLDFITHESYGAAADELVGQTLARGAAGGIREVIAQIVECDEVKELVLRRAGFRDVGLLPDQVRVGEQRYGIRLLHRSLS